MEGAWLWHHVRYREANVGVRSEPSQRTQTSTHCPLLWPHYWPQQCNPVHHNGVLRGWRSCISHQQNEKRRVRITEILFYSYISIEQPFICLLFTWQRTKFKIAHISFWLQMESCISWFFYKFFFLIFLYESLIPNLVSGLYVNFQSSHRGGLCMESVLSDDHGCQRVS